MTYRNQAQPQKLPEKVHLKGKHIDKVLKTLDRDAQIGS